MKKILLILLVLILGIAGYFWYKFSHTGSRNKGPKQQPIALLKHSAAFNTSVSNTMNAYFQLSAAFVEADTVGVKKHAGNFVALLDSIPMNELQKDSAVVLQTATDIFSSVRSNTESLLKQTDLKEMRMDYRQVSEQLYSFLKAVNYEGDNIYWQYCPMAFGDDNGANWLSKEKQVTNPYLGRNHPEHGITMLHCGETKDTIKTK